MIVLGLITCIVLRAFSAQAKVVPNFNECGSFFYKNTEPRGMDQNAKKICQKLVNGSFHYASLYSVHHKIPLYSAYTLDPGCSRDTEKKDIWHLEPQISQSTAQIFYMVCENQNDSNIYKENQAISSDYSDSGYDRGHLNPSNFQCGDGRTATFTLTNAAPMDTCFNRVHWKNWENTLRRFLKNKLEREQGDSATAFIVTGTVPNTKVRIPHRGTSEEPERVTVPSHIWTAVCYKHHKYDSKSFSFAYMGRNQPESGINLMSVSDLNNRLSRLYSELPGTHQSIKIFFDDCFVYKNKLHEVTEVFEELFNLPVNQADQMSSEIQNTYLTVKKTLSSDSIPEKKVKVSEMAVKLTFDSISNYYNVADDLKVFAKSTCLITNAKPLERKIEIDQFGKRDLFKGSDAVKCLLVPEKQNTAADGSLCSCIKQYDDSWRCNTEGKTKHCCSSSCIYQDNLKGYRCYSGQKLIECSPPYSLITHNGQKCLDNHPCATYDKDYYWCKTGTAGFFNKAWDYCSPPLRYSKAKNGKYCRSNHACAKYGTSNPWCYTDDEGNYEQCCTSDDCHSTVNGQTCRSGHDCGYHGKGYLWCYTDNGDWEYCCTECSK